MLKDRVSAGLKILGIYFSIIAFEKVLLLGLTFYFRQLELKQSAAYMGQAASPMAQAAVIRQGVGYISGAVFYLIAAILCIKFTSVLVGFCVGSEGGKSA
jgi:hypothetical protein